jgi:hypothetical protein
MGHPVGVRMEKMEKRSLTKERPRTATEDAARALFVGLLGAILLLAFAPRGSRSLGYLCETSSHVVVGKVEKSAKNVPGGQAWRISVETVLKGKVPKSRVTVWIPDFDPALRLDPGQRALLFLSPVPDRPLFRRLKVVGRRLWRVEGSVAGVADPQLASPVQALISALGTGSGQEILTVLAEQAKHADRRVRHDAAADLERRCPSGCDLDATSQARLRALAEGAPAGSDYRKSLLRVIGADKHGGEGEIR